MFAFKSFQFNLHETNKNGSLKAYPSFFFYFKGCNNCRSMIRINLLFILKLTLKANKNVTVIKTSKVLQREKASFALRRRMMWITLSYDEKYKESSHSFYSPSANFLMLGWFIVIFNIYEKRQVCNCEENFCSHVTSRFCCWHAEA